MSPFVQRGRGTPLCFPSLLALPDSFFLLHLSFSHSSTSPTPPPIPLSLITLQSHAHITVSLKASCGWSSQSNARLHILHLSPHHHHPCVYVCDPPLALEGQRTLLTHTQQSKPKNERTSVSLCAVLFSPKCVCVGGDGGFTTYKQLCVDQQVELCLFF